MDNPTERMVDALDLIAGELGLLRILLEHELGVRVEYSPDPHVVKVVKDDATEE
jgi:hypothetical protein